MGTGEFRLDFHLTSLFNSSICIGYRKPLTSITLSDKSEIVDILKCHCQKTTIPDMDQFAEGLESLGILSYIRKYPDLMRPLFVAEQQEPLTACKYYVNNKDSSLLTLF